MIFNQAGGGEVLIMLHAVDKTPFDLASLRSCDEARHVSPDQADHHLYKEINLSFWVLPVGRAAGPSGGILYLSGDEVVRSRQHCAAKSGDLYNHVARTTA